MKKSLIALAIAAASTTAFAGADVYGQARMSIDKSSGSGATETQKKTSMNDRVSRIGVKGSEDLGGGMSAVYGIEWGVDITDQDASTSSDSPLSARNAFVGLKGAFGTVLGGKHDTPYKLAGSADLFGDTAADSQGSTGIIGYGNFDLRATNALAYISPDWNGFHFAAAVTNNGTTTTNGANISDSTSLALVYVNGPLKATYGYENHGDKTLSTSAEVATAGEKANKFNVAYKIGDIALGYTYEKQDRQTVAGTTTATAAGDAKNQVASVAYGMGPITLAAQYGKRNTTNDSLDKNRTTLGVIYALSKKTNAAVAYNSDKDGNGTTTKVNTTTVQLNHAF